MPTKTPSEIVKAAYTYMMEVLDSSKISAARVEELVPETTGTRKTWNVVISYEIMGNFPFDRTREYKQFKVDEEGVVLEMKIKKI